MDWSAISGQLFRSRDQVSEGFDSIRGDIEFMKPKEMYKMMLSESITPLFKEKGYKKKNNVFVREYPEVVQIVHLAASSWNLPDYYDFSNDFALFSKPYYALMQYELPKSWFNSTLHRPILGGNIQHLKAPRGYTPDYHIVSETNMSKVAEALRSDLVNYIFPYIDPLRSTDSLIKAIEVAKEQDIFGSLPNIHDEIILYYSLDHKETAQTKLIEALSIEHGNPYYKPKLIEIAEKLGLDLP